MKWIGLNIFFLLATILCYCQNNLCGYVIEKKAKAVIPFATVFNKTKNIGVYTDSTGYFSLNASLNDTLYFANIGFESFILILKAENNCDTVYLKPTTNQLATIEVSDFYWLKNKSLELGELNKHGNYVDWIIPGVTVIKYFKTRGTERKYIIGSLKIKVSQNIVQYEPRLARIHLYRSEANGEIGSSLIDGDEIFTIEKPNSEFISSDLNKYKIIAPEQGF